MKIITESVVAADPAERPTRDPHGHAEVAVPVGVELIGSSSTTPAFLRALSQAEAIPALPGLDPGMTGGQSSVGGRSPLLPPPGSRLGTRRAGVDGAGVHADSPPAGQVVTFVERADLAALDARHGTVVAGAPAAIVAHVVGAHLRAEGPQGGRAEGQASSSQGTVVVHLRGHRDGGTQADMVIRHPTLGRIEIAIGVDGQRVSLAVRARSRSAQASLSAARGDLCAVLAAQGFELYECNIATDRVGSVEQHQGRFRHLDLEV